MSIETSGHFHATLLLMVIHVIGATTVFADEPEIKGSWTGVAVIFGGSPVLERRNWTLTIADEEYSETFETVREGEYSTDVNSTPAEINMSYGGSDRSQGIYRIERDELTICFADQRPVDFADKQSEVYVLTRSMDPEWSMLRSDDHPIRGSWNVKSFAFGGGEVIRQYKEGDQTFVFGRKRFVMRHTDKKNGTLKVNSSQTPKVIVFKPSGVEEQKRQFWFEDGHLFVSDPSVSSYISVYRRKKARE